MRFSKTLAGFWIVVGFAAAAAAQDSPPSVTAPRGSAVLGKLPLYFVENRAVYPDEVSYSIQGADKTLFFTRDGITFRLRGKDQGWVVKLDFVDASPDVVLRGEDRQEAVFSYFKGPAKDWKTGLRTYASLVYQNLWPGIDLIYRGTVNRLKYEFVVAPGVDPGKIRLRYRGASRVSIPSTGALRIDTPAGSFEDAPPRGLAGYRRQTCARGHGLCARSRP